MPWEERTVYEMREEFVRRAHAKQESLSALCREYGITRRTGYKWLERAEAGEALEDRSRRPKKVHRITSEMEQEIVRRREEHPALGAVKLHRIMLNEGYDDLPSAKTFNNVFKRNGLISREASLNATPCRRFERAEANDMWQGDFLGHFPMGNGEHCHPLNILDDHSRYNLCSEPLKGETFEEVQPVMIELFKTYGKPKVFLCDNGNPWGTVQSTGYTRFEVWLMDHGILTIHGRVKHPQTQGKEERFNQTMQRELLRQRLIVDWQDAAEKFKEYRTFYNEIRPHHALHLDTPSQHYQRSQRVYCESVPEWEYPEGTALREVKKTGFITWKGQGYFLSEAFGGHRIGLRESRVEGCVNLFYRQFRIARIDVERRVFTLKRAYLIDDDPRLMDT